MSESEAKFERILDEISRLRRKESGHKGIMLGGFAVLCATILLTQDGVFLETKDSGGGLTPRVVISKGSDLATIKFQKSDLWLEPPDASNTSNLKFFELTTNGTNYVGFKAPNSIAADKMWKLPAADGAADNILKTDGAGNLSFVAASTVAVTSVSAGNTTISIGGTTTAPTVSINLSNANTWTGAQTFATSTATDDTLKLAPTNIGGASFLGTLTNADLTAAQTWTFPNASGTVITTGNMTSITTTGTITSGTWNGSLVGLAYGGTNANLTASNGGIFYSTATAGAILSGTATAGQILRSGASAAPSWSTATFADTYTASNILYSNGANAVQGLATANDGVLITSGAGVPSISSTLPSAVQGNITTVGTITSGTWNGGTIAVGYGGTGANLSAGAAIGDILYANSATTFARIADIATGNALISGGVGTAPSWGKIGLTTHVNGTLAVGNGGTGTATAFTSGSVVFAGGSGVYTQDNANLFWDDTTNRLGIGTASPSQKLEVNGASKLGTINQGFNSTERFYPTIVSSAQNATVNGAWIIHTPMPRASNTMFKIRVHGYAYNAVKVIDFTVVGYSYAAGVGNIDGLAGAITNADITDAGTETRSKYVGIDASGNVAIAYGDTGDSSYYYRITVDAWITLGSGSDYSTGWSIDQSTVANFNWKDKTGPMKPSGSNAYVLNQSASAQTANFLISGTGQANTDLRAPIFYDSNNTSYYIDPNSNSQVSSIYANGWFRAQGNTGIYFQDYGGGWYMTDTTWIRSYNSKDVYVNTFLRADGGIASGSVASLGSGTIHATGQVRGTAFYDYNDTSYYLDPNGNSNINTLTKIRAYGAGVDTGLSPEYYAIYQEAGAWASPYPDLRIQYHTGIKYDAYYGYNGHRFYTGYDGTGNPTGLNFSIGDGDTNVRAYNAFLTPILYDMDDSTYFVNPAGATAAALSGNVGIGTASPDGKLDTRGIAFLGSNTSGGTTADHRIKFTDSWTGFPDTTYGSEICNDTASYKTLMIIGNRSNNGSTRRVSVWDQLIVNGSAQITNTLDMTTTKITNLATPTANADAATKAYVDAQVGGNNGKSRSQYFTSNGTFTVPANVTLVWVTSWGGGGGGGSGYYSGGWRYGGGGGGGGECVYRFPVTVTPAQNIAVTIGGGGNGGSPTASGTAGGNTTFGSYVTAKGGSGGLYWNDGGSGGGSLGGTGGRWESVTTTELGAGTALDGHANDDWAVYNTNTLKDAQRGTVWAYVIGGSGGGIGYLNTHGPNDGAAFGFYSGGTASNGGGGGAGFKGNGGNGGAAWGGAGTAAGANSGAGGGGGAADSASAAAAGPGGAGGSGGCIVEWIE